MAREGEGSVDSPFTKDCSNEYSPKYPSIANTENNVLEANNHTSRDEMRSTDRPGLNRGYASRGVQKCMVCSSSRWHFSRHWVCETRGRKGNGMDEEAGRRGAWHE